MTKNDQDSGNFFVTKVAFFFFTTVLFNFHYSYFTL